MKMNDNEKEQFKKEKAAFEGDAPELIITPIPIDQIEEESSESAEGDPFGDNPGEQFEGTVTAVTLICTCEGDSSTE